MRRWHRRPSIWGSTGCDLFCKLLRVNVRGCAGTVVDLSGSWRFLVILCRCLTGFDSYFAPASRCSMQYWSTFSEFSHSFHIVWSRVEEAVVPKQRCLLFKAYVHLFTFIYMYMSLPKHMFIQFLFKIDANLLWSIPSLSKHASCSDLIQSWWKPSLTRPFHIWFRRLS